jgi:hypothetical protein
MKRSQSFGLFTEFVNTLSWNASTDPTVTGFLIYRNGQQIGSGPSNATTFIDHNQVQNGTLTYGVFFLVSNGDESAITSANFP